MTTASRVLYGMILLGKAAYGGALFLYLFGTKTPNDTVFVSFTDVNFTRNRATGSGDGSGGYGGGIGWTLPFDVQVPSASCGDPPTYWNWT